MVEEWFKSIELDGIALSSITLFEIRYGLNLMPNSAKRLHLELVFLKIKSAALFGRLLPFGTLTAEFAADVFAKRRRMGRPVAVPDCLIAGHVLEHGATLATRNIRDFDGVGLSLFNPWETAS